MVGKHKDIVMINIHECVSLKPYTVFKIGGPARYFCEIQNAEALQEAVRWAKAHTTPFVVLGSGSNVLVSDNGYPGLVIRLLMRDTEKISDEVLYVAAGASMATVAHFATTCGLGGFEWAIGIPGTIGGSIVGNAGCYGSEMKDVVQTITILECPIFNFQFSINESISNDLNIENSLKIENGKLNIHETNNKDCNFSYRHSIFKDHPERIIIGAELKLFPRDSAESTALVREYSTKRTITQDIGSPCAGCIFKNPKNDKPGLSISAGQLIDAAGLKGMRVGGAMVSLKHGNFIINTGNATARDVKELISIIKSKVKSAHGVELEEEIRYIG